MRRPGYLPTLQRIRARFNQLFVIKRRGQTAASPASAVRASIDTRDGAHRRETN